MTRICLSFMKNVMLQHDPASLLDDMASMKISNSTSLGNSVDKSRRRSSGPAIQGREDEESVLRQLIEMDYSWLSSES